MMDETLSDEYIDNTIRGADEGIGHPPADLLAAFRELRRRRDVDLVIVPKIDQPDVAAEIELQGGRKIHVIEVEGSCERTGQVLYSCFGLRSWTGNGEIVACDVIVSLVEAERAREDAGTPTTLAQYEYLDREFGVGEGSLHPDVAEGEYGFPPLVAPCLQVYVPPVPEGIDLAAPPLRGRRMMVWQATEFKNGERAWVRIPSYGRVRS